MPPPIDRLPPAATQREIPPADPASPPMDATPSAPSVPAPPAAPIDAREGASPPAPIRMVHAATIDGAFSGVAPARGVSQRLSARASAAQGLDLPPWRGPVLNTREIGETREAQLLDEGPTRARLIAHGSFDPFRPPVVLVHGIDGNPGELADLADRLTDEGRQVFVLAYRDQGQLTSTSGYAFAQALTELRTHYPPGTDLAIVAHSMGGIVTRAALNTLEDPTWMGDTPDVQAAPRAGFSEITVETIDTPWSGFNHEPEWISWFIAPFIHFFMWLFGMVGGFEMRGNSDLFENLYDTELGGVSIRNHVATQEPADKIPSLYELNREQQRQVALFLTEGTEPDDTLARNLGRFLTQESRYGVFRAAIDGGSGDVVDRMLEAYRQTMPGVEGGHTEVLTHDSGAHDDVVDRLGRQLSARP